MLQLANQPGGLVLNSGRSAIDRKSHVISARDCSTDERGGSLASLQEQPFSSHELLHEDSLFESEHQKAHFKIRCPELR